MFRTVADLKRYLTETSLTPEALAQQVDISNMTIRRLIKRSPATRLPTKYAVLLNHLVLAPVEAQGNDTLGVGGFEPFITDLETQGGGVANFEELEEKMTPKLQEVGVGAALRDRVRLLQKAVREKATAARERSVCLGALTYFVNPLDLVPDALPTVGFVDDFGVVSLALTALFQVRKR